MMKKEGALLDASGARIAVGKAKTLRAQRRSTHRPAPFSSPRVALTHATSLSCPRRTHRPARFEVRILRTKSSYWGQDSSDFACDDKVRRTP